MFLISVKAKNSGLFHVPLTSAHFGYVTEVNPPKIKLGNSIKEEIRKFNTYSCSLL